MHVAVQFHTLTQPTAGAWARTLAVCPGSVQTWPPLPMS